MKLANKYLDLFKLVEIFIETRLRISLNTFGLEV